MSFHSPTFAAARERGGWSMRMSAAAQPHNLTGRLELVERRVERDDASPQGKLAIRDILEVVRRRACGPLLPVIGGGGYWLATRWLS
jgi:hypothetical protein